MQNLNFLHPLQMWNTNNKTYKLSDYLFGHGTNPIWMADWILMKQTKCFDGHKLRKKLKTILKIFKGLF